MSIFSKIIRFQFPTIGAPVMPGLAIFFVTMLFTPGCGERNSMPGSSDGLTGISVPRAGQLPYFRGAIMDPYWPDGAGALPANLRGLKSVAGRKSSLRDHDGIALQSADLQGRHTLVYFFYATCSGICPLLTANMRRLAGQLKLEDRADLQILAITVDPERDGQLQLRSFRAKHTIKSEKWRFFTGAFDEIRSIARDQFAGNIQTREGLGAMLDFVHTENVFLLDRDGYLRGIYRARGTGDLERLKIELETLRSAG